MKTAKRAEKPEIRRNMDIPVMPYYDIAASVGNQAALRMAVIQRMNGNESSTEDNNRICYHFSQENNLTPVNMPAEYKAWRLSVRSIIFKLSHYILSQNSEEPINGEEDFKVLAGLLAHEDGSMDPHKNLEMIRNEAAGLRRYFYYYMRDGERREANARILLYHIRYILLLLYGVEGAKELALVGTVQMIAEIQKNNPSHKKLLKNPIIIIEKNVPSSPTSWTWDEMEAAEKKLDDADGKLIFQMINQLESQVNNLKREDFHKKLKDAIPVYLGQDRCHTISNAYIKAGVFTPILDAAAALLRFMARREDWMPEEGTAFYLKTALWGILFAVFPADLDWESEQPEVTELSKYYWRWAYALIDRIELCYGTLKSEMESRTVREFDMNAMQQIMSCGAELYDVLNNSPQNLRLGNSSTNRSIQEGLDIPLSDIEETTLNGDYTDDLAKLTTPSGKMEGAEVYHVKKDSMSHKALLALLTLVKLGDEEIHAFSGIQSETQKSTMQSSELFRVGENNLDADTKALVVSLEIWSNNREGTLGYTLGELVDMKGFIKYFRFTLVNGTVKPSKPLKRLHPPLGWDSLTKEQQRMRVIRRLQTVAVTEQLKTKNYHLQEDKSKRQSRSDNCFFYAIYEQLVPQLTHHEIQVPSVEALAKAVRKPINNHYNFIQLDNGQGVDVLNALVTVLHGNLNVHLMVTEPQDYDYNTGVITFVDREFDSDDVADAPVIFLHIYFNGYDHFTGIKMLQNEMEEGKETG